MNQIFVERAVPQDTNTPENRRVRSVRVNIAESPLGWLKARDLVTERQFAAGELLRMDYERASLAPRVTMIWDAAPMDSNRRSAAEPGAATLGQLSAKDRFDKAMAQAGPGLADILWRVVCAGDSMPIAEKTLGWPTRAGRLVLTLALDRVADYYHIK